MPDYLDLATFKLHAAIDHSYTDALCTSYLDAAEAYLGSPTDGYLRRPVVATEFAETFPDFNSISLRYPAGVDAALIEVGGASVGNIFTVSGGDVTLNAGGAWPDAPDGLTVTYTAGWPVDQIPAPIVAAGYFVAATLFDQRSAGETSTSLLKDYLDVALAGYRRPRV